MGWTQKSCCCCISVKTGTMILGVCMLINLLKEIEEFYPLRLAATATASIAFILMIFDDSEFKRKLFFYTFMIATLVIFYFSAVTTSEYLEKEAPWKKACDDVAADGGLKSFHTNNLEECHEKTSNIIYTAVITIFIISAIVHIHFFAVVYTHWKNSDKDNGAPRIELQDETMTV